MELTAPPVSDEVIDEILSEIVKAERPVMHAGYGIRLSGGFEAFRTAIDNSCGYVGMGGCKRFF